TPGRPLARGPGNAGTDSGSPGRPAGKAAGAGASGRRLGGRPGCAGALVLSSALGEPFVVLLGTAGLLAAACAGVLGSCHVGVLERGGLRSRFCAVMLAARAKKRRGDARRLSS